MTQYDQLMLFAVLGAVAAFLLVLARQSRPNVDAPGVPAEKPVREVVLSNAAPEVIEPITPALSDVPPPPVAAQDEPPVKRRRTRRRKTPPVLAATAGKTPIDSVLALLRDKNALTTAFLLREILDAPRSRREV